MARPILIDCDPGIDDCIALMVALGSPDELDVRAICTVAGNVPVETCTRNAGGVAALAGRGDIPIHAGCPRPMVEAPVFADHIHGENGLGDAVLPEPLNPVSDVHAVPALIEALRGAGEEGLTLVITGPMTNLAVALVQAPDIAEGIREIIIMGGARREGGNITGSAEFNIYADPHAARTVLRCGRPITLIGLDTTLQIRATPARMERMRGLGTTAARAADLMIAHVNRVYGEIYGTEGAALHDPCTIACLLAPELFTLRPAHVDVETRAGLTRGHTAVELFGQSETGGAVSWADGLDAEAVFDLILERMGRL
jgi:inosine-uridine nucleoside N-ribohydrolase